MKSTEFSRRVYIYTYICVTFRCFDADDDDDDDDGDGDGDGDGVLMMVMVMVMEVVMMVVMIMFIAMLQAETVKAVDSILSTLKTPFNWQFIKQWRCTSIRVRQPTSPSIILAHDM